MNFASDWYYSISHALAFCKKRCATRGRDNERVYSSGLFFNPI